MIFLITAVPGSGKTLFVVQLIQKFLSEGRNVYANIEGLTIPSVLISPQDWRECPDGSVVVYDECQQMFPPDGSGRSTNTIISDLEIHRHRGFDIILITQHPKLLHSHVRRLVGRHYHLFRMFGTETAKVFSRDGHIDVDKPSMLHAQDNYLWVFPKELYGLYKSATIHTHKRQLPKWMVRGLILTGAFVIISTVLIYFSFGFFSGKVSALDRAKNEETLLVPALNQVTKLEGISNTIFVDPTQEEALRPSGCVWNDKKCTCYDTHGVLLKLSYSQCIAIADTPHQKIVLTSKSGWH